MTFNKKIATFAISNDQTKITETGRTLSGYAIIWGAVSQFPLPQDGKRYVFNKGSIDFDKTVFALNGHDWDMPIASTANGTLRLIPDDIGVKVEMDLTANTSIVNDAYENVKAKLITGMSFGGLFSTLKSKPTSTPGVFEAISLMVYEVSITPIPNMIEAYVCIGEDEETDTEDTQAEQTVKHSDPVKSEVSEEKKKELRNEQAKLDTYKLSFIKSGRESGK